jgi:hypothetical protein
VLSSPFKGEIKGTDGELRDATRFWSMLIPAFLHQLDQLQCMEVIAVVHDALDG